MQNAKCKIKNKNLQSKICNLQFAIKQQGFSLVELLISMAIAVIVGMAGYVIFSSSNWSYKVQEDVSEAQQNVRVAMERFAGDVRTAGFGLPDPPLPTFWFDVNGNNAQDAGETFTSPITVTNSSTGPDTITILGIGYEAGKLMRSGTVTCNNGIVANDSGANCIRLDSANNSFFSSTSPYPYQSSRRYMSLSGSTFIELSSTAGDHDRSAGTMRLSSPATLDRSYPDNTPVYIIQAVQYAIVDNDAASSPPCTTANPCLRSQDLTALRGSGSQTLAENIEDIQFAYGIDESPRDGNLDYSGTYDSADFSNDPTDDSSIIAVRATVVAKTRNQDPKGATGFKSQCFEDRPADAGTTNCTGAGPDGYRRRALTKVIKLRNPKQGA